VRGHALDLLDDVVAVLVGNAREHAPAQLRDQRGAAVLGVVRLVRVLGNDLPGFQGVGEVRGLGRAVPNTGWAAQVQCASAARGGFGMDGEEL